MPSREWRVVIVEDEPIARLGLRSMVGALPDATLVDVCGATEGLAYGFSQVRAGDEDREA